MLSALALAIESRDPYTRGHSTRVGQLAEAVAAWLGWTDERLRELRTGAALHDVGKLAVPAELLRKPGPLTPRETSQVRAHPVAGARLVRRVASATGALPYVLCHHERWDGRGYPQGLTGIEIPVGARLLAVADAYDAMTSDRPYRAALPPGRALAELDRCAGSQFDPALTRAFLEVWGTSTAAAAG